MYLYIQLLKFKISMKTPVCKFFQLQQEFYAKFQVVGVRLY